LVRAPVATGLDDVALPNQKTALLLSVFAFNPTFGGLVLQISALADTTSAPVLIVTVSEIASLAGF